MIDLVRVPAWREYTWLRHGFSTRLGGISTSYGDPSLNLGWTKEDEPAHVLKNRSLLLKTITGASGSRAITLRQIHTTDIHSIKDAAVPFATSEGRAILEGDGLSTALPGIFLGIQTADCVPVMLVDPVKKAVSVLHAGWRGTAAAMSEKGVAHMARHYGSNPDDLLAAIGPSIGACCYTIGDEVRSAFHARFSYAPELFRGDRLNLWEANRRQLLTAGLRPQNTTALAECTGCTFNSAGDRRYFSHRVDQGTTGRMMSVIGIASA